MADLSTRPLMPYELRLCQELGVTEEEYRQFLDAMHTQMVRRPMPGDAIRNEFVTPILAIVGLIFQVVGLLLRPSQPQPQGAAQAPPGEQAAPTYGFSSVQDLARIGEAVPQVYCDRSANPAGGCRVNTQLIWSQVESWGNAQLGKFLTVVSDAELVEVDGMATGVGGTLVQAVASNTSWQYYVSRNGQNGYIQQNAAPFRQYFTGAGRDPGDDPSGAATYRPPRGDIRDFGTCQAYTPNSRTTFGIGQVIPFANIIRNLYSSSDGTETVISDWTRIRIDSTTANYIRWASVPSYLVGNHVATLSFEPYQNEVTTVQVNRTITRQVPVKNTIPTPAFDAQGNLLGATWVEVVTDTQTITETTTENVTVDNKVAIKHSQLRNSIAQGLVPTANYILGRCTFQFMGYSPGSNTDIRKGNVAANFRLIDGYGYAAFGSEYDGRFPLFDNELNNLYNPNTPPKERLVLAQAEFGVYVTNGQVDAVEVSIKANVWAELNSPFRNDQSSNGMRPRTAFFRCRYRKVGESTFTDIAGLFSVTRASKSEIFFFIRFEFPSRAQWEIQFNPVIDWVIDYPNYIYQIDPAQWAFSEYVSGGVRVCFRGNKLVTSGSTDLANYVFSYAEGTRATWRSDQVYRPLMDANYSFEQGTEFEIVCANEIQYDNNHVTYYSDLSMLGLNIYGGRSRQDIQQISALVKRGKRIARIDNGSISTYDASNRFPDIFYDTLTSKTSGLGQFVTSAMVDLESLSLSNRFVTQNQMYWDGVVDKEAGWRNWATEQAGYSLLQVATRNGKFGLVPVVPVDTAGNISPTGYTIKAMFNEGNILKDSYTESVVSAEETINQIVTVRYRELQANTSTGVVGFPRERSISMRLNEGSNDDREIVVNAAASVTTEAQAKKIATYLLTARRYEDRTIAFKTAEPWLSVGPGDIIRVDTTFTAFQSNYAGRVLEDGTIDLYGYDGAKTASGTALIYKPGVGIQTIGISAGSKLPGYAGSLIAIGTQTSENRLWTITRVDIDEDGIATINAKLFPLVDGGGTRASLVATALQSPSSYVTQIYR